MIEKDQLQVRTKDVLRVALDRRATQDYAAMVEKLKQMSPYIKLHPSQFVSFLVSDFYSTYFAKDLEILAAEFFDAQGFYQAQLHQIKSQDNFEDVMADALATIKRTKSKARRKVIKRKQSTTLSPKGASHV